MLRIHWNSWTEIHKNLQCAVAGCLAAPLNSMGTLMSTSIQRGGNDDVPSHLSSLNEKRTL